MRYVREGVFLLLLYNTFCMFSVALFHRTADATICHENNLNCFSVNSTVLNDFLLTGGTDIDSLMHVISSRFLIMFCMLLLAVVLVLFLPCDALRCTVFVIVILSVCLSVCPSVTLMDCVHMVRPTIVISSPYGSPIILVSGVSRSSQNSKGVTPSEGVE